MGIHVFTDGACCGNPGPAGIGVILEEGDGPREEFKKYIGPATNNVAELAAIEEALHTLLYRAQEKEESIVIHTDSRYAIGVLTNPSWRPKKNKVLISRIKEKMSKFSHLFFTHIPGARNPADGPAKQAAKRL